MKALDRFTFLGGGYWISAALDARISLQDRHTYRVLLDFSRSTQKLATANGRSTGRPLRFRSAEAAAQWIIYFRQRESRKR